MLRLIDIIPGKKTGCWTEEIFNMNKKWQGIVRSTRTYIDLTQITTVTQSSMIQALIEGMEWFVVLLYIAQRTESRNIWYWYKPCLDWQNRVALSKKLHWWQTQGCKRCSTSCTIFKIESNLTTFKKWSTNVSNLI